MYEYVDNGNLEQWLHGDVGPISPLTWDIRMKIAIGTAKGYVCTFLLFLTTNNFIFLLVFLIYIESGLFALGWHIYTKDWNQKLFIVMLNQATYSWIKIGTQK